VLIAKSHFFAHWWLDGGWIWSFLLGALLLLVTVLLVLLHRSRNRIALREARFENLLGYLDDVFWTSSSDGKVLYVSRAVEKIYGRPVRDFIDNPYLWHEMIHPEDRSQVPDTFERLPAEGYLAREYRIVRPDGEVRWVLDRKTLVGSGDEEPKLMGGAVTDITPRKQYEQVLQRSEVTYRSLFETNNVVSLLIDPESGRIADANQAACDYYGHGREKLLEMRIDQINQLSPEEIRDEMHRAKASDRNHFFFKHLLADGRVRDVEVYSNPVTIGGEKMLFSIIHDVTDRRRAERRLKEHEGKLKALASQLALVEERNRQEIAAALHDRIGQTLAALKVRAGLLQQATDLEEVRARGEKMIDDLDLLMQEAWSLTFELCPPALYEVGLNAAIEWLCQETSKRHDLEIEYVDDGKAKPLRDRIRGMIFQMVRELLSNVVKHAGATHVVIRSKRDGEWLQIAVEDNGAGFDVEAQTGENQSTGGFGLFSIRERLGHFSGRLEARSIRGQGSCMRLLLPLAAGPGNADAKDQIDESNSDHPGRRSSTDERRSA
jgi:PAS domain S-box-containing protein